LTSLNKESNLIEELMRLKQNLKEEHFTRLESVEIFNYINDFVLETPLEK
jgi:hypothetical protein